MPSPDLLCREERVEDPVDDVRWYAHARIPHGELHSIVPASMSWGTPSESSTSEIGKPHFEGPSFFPHRIGRIGAEVHEDLLDLDGVGEDEA